MDQQKLKGNRRSLVPMGIWRDWIRGGWVAWCDGHEARSPSEAEAVARACEMRIEELIAAQAKTEH